MLKKIRLLVFVSLIFLINIEFVDAYTISSDNNPGSEHTAGTGSNATKGTNWGHPYFLKAVRVRVFRKDTVLKSAYFSLAEQESGCYSSVKGTLCETSSYNYSTVNSTSGVSCSSTILSLGCIVGTDLNKSMYWNDGAIADGVPLDKLLKADDYANLKSLLEGIGYNNTDFSDKDVVIVEPVTSVICNSSKYIGTSTALMKKNVSYRGSGGNVCSGNDGYNGKTFLNVYRNISKAFKVTTSNFSDSTYTGFGFFKYNVSDVFRGLGSLKITKVNSNNDKLAQLTSSTTAKFRLYTNSSCSEGTHIKDFEAGETISDLTLGTYYLKEYRAKTGYHTPQSGEEWYCKAITISSGLNEITITNKTECEYKFKSNMTMKERIDLYNLIKTNYNHEFNALLDMNNTTAASACSNIPAVKNYTKSCFGAGNTITNSSNFSNTNVSMYTEKYGTYTFCLTKYNMVNNLGKTRFNNIQAGKAIISTDSVVATATLNRVCYNFGDETIEDQEYNNLSYSNYIEEDASIGGVPLIKTETSSGTINNKTITATYTLPEMYASNKDGKIYYGYCPIGEYCKSLGRGIISKFNLKPSNPLSPSTPSTPSTPSMPSKNTYYELGFNIKLDNLGELKSSSDCTYTIKTGLITPNNKLNIEFRTVNTNSESIFLGKDGSNRKIGSNWSKEEDREFVLNVKNNSYNKNNEEPLYTILLTPDTMEDIRKDNKDKTYDDYNMTCTEDGMTCISNYLTCLVNSNELQIKPIRKNLDKFKENQIVCKY